MNTEEIKSVKPTGLALLRMPFEKHQISKLPKPTKAQTEAVKADSKKGIRCKECGTWHHPEVVHLDYVGHAALTDRLLETDLNWDWEPMSLVDGLPKFDTFGGLWIRLTVCGKNRLGYGNAEPSTFKEIGSREKEVIGDALRNAAMRFGAALDLWHKGDLHIDNEPPKTSTPSFFSDNNDLEDLSNFVIQLGVKSKMTGKTLKDFSKEYLKEQSAYWTGISAKNNAPLTGGHKDFVDAVKIYANT